MSSSVDSHQPHRHNIAQLIPPIAIGGVEGGESDVEITRLITVHN